MSQVFGFLRHIQLMDGQMAVSKGGFCALSGGEIETDLGHKDDVPWEARCPQCVKHRETA